MRALLLALFLALPADRDLADALRDLVSPAAAERGSAERWIAAHARTADFPELAGAVDRAGPGGAEVALRLARALGADERHLGLAVLFARETDPDLARVGQEAIRDLLALWSDGLSGRFLGGPRDLGLRRLLERTRESFPGEHYLLAAEGSLIEATDRLVRLSGVNMPVVIDPLLDEDTGLANDRPWFTGTWDQILMELAVQAGVTVQAPIAKDPSGRDVPVFLALRSASLRNASVEQTLLDWCLQSTESGPAGTRAARALGETLWPAAVGWLAERWLETGDRRALLGLLAAAARGRVHPRLERSDAVARLVELADRAARARDPESRRLVDDVHRALAKLGPVSLDGVALDALLLLGAEVEPDEARTADAARRLAARPDELLWRLFALEGMGPTSPAALDVLAALIAAEDLPRPLRLQALRARAAAPAHTGGRLALGAPEAFCFEVEKRADAREAAHLLLTCGVDLPRAWRAPEATAVLPVTARALVLEVLLGRGEEEAVRGHLEGLCELERGLFPSRDVLEARAEVARVLRDWVRRGEGRRVATLLERMRDAAPDASYARALHTIAIGAGAETPEAERRDLELLVLTVAGEIGNVVEREELFGALCARETEAVAAAARRLLTERLQFVLQAPAGGVVPAIEETVRGFERAIDEFLAEGDERTAQELANVVRGAFRGRPLDAATLRIALPSWPPGRGAPVELARLERTVAAR